jgi:hypothetical protein
MCLSDSLLPSFPKDIFFVFNVESKICQVQNLINFLKYASLQKNPVDMMQGSLK